MTPEEYSGAMAEMRQWALGTLGIGLLVSIPIVAIACVWDRPDPRATTPNADYRCGPIFDCCVGPQLPFDRCLETIEVCRTPGKPGGGCETATQDPFGAMMGDAGR